MLPRAYYAYLTLHEQISEIVDRGGVITMRDNPSPPAATLHHRPHSGPAAHCAAHAPVTGVRVTHSSDRAAPHSHTIVCVNTGFRRGAWYGRAMGAAHARAQCVGVNSDSMIVCLHAPRPGNRIVVALAATIPQDRLNRA